MQARRGFRVAEADGQIERLCFRSVTGLTATASTYCNMMPEESISKMCEGMMDKNTGG